MSPVTLHDKALAHLYRYNYVSSDIQYGAPFEITQDGVAMALGITRSHASLQLGKMRDRKEVLIGQSTIKKSGRSTRRMVYHLTEYGKNLYLERKDELDAEGFDIGDLRLDINQCGSEEYARLTPEQSDMIGGLCVLRSDIRKDQVPEGLPLIVFNNDGTAYFKNGAKERFLRSGTDGDLRRWHSKAADWCLDYGGNLRERIYHLEKAGRDREAIRIMKENRYGLMDDSDQELAEIASGLAMRNDDQELNLIAARISIRCRDLDTAEMIVSAICEKDPGKADPLRTEILLGKHRDDDALDLAVRCGNGDTDSGLALGMCLVRTSHFNEAKECLERTRIGMTDSRCLFRMDEVLQYEALAELGLERRDAAIMLIDTAVSLSRNDRRRSGLIALGERIRAFSEDGVLLQGIEV